MHILNIGHAIGNSGAQHTLAHIVQAFERTGMAIAQVNVVESDTETTSVIRTPHWDSHAVFTLAQVLGQDCIAVWHPLRLGQPGELIGPDAEAWGAFDPAFFILPEGNRLATFLPATAEA